MSQMPPLLSHPPWGSPYPPPGAHASLQTQSSTPASGAAQGASTPFGSDDHGRMGPSTPYSFLTYGKVRDHRCSNRHNNGYSSRRHADASSQDEQNESDSSRTSSSSSSSTSDLHPSRSKTLSGRGLKHNTPNVRVTKKYWSLRAPLDDQTWKCLRVPVLVIVDLSSTDTHFSSDPTAEQLKQGPDALKMDHFTYQLWMRHIQSKQQYGIKSVVPDSFYINVVKELHQPGHLDRSGLKAECYPLWKALTEKKHRNARYILFDPPSSARTGYAQGMPLLAMVKTETQALMSPTFDDCVRVIPISQVRPLLEELHKEMGHKVTGISMHVLLKYTGIPRDVCELYQQHCLPCREFQAQDRRKAVVKPIRQRWPRYRYLTDLITMTTVTAADGQTYTYILTMIDHYSRHWWARSLVNKTAAGVIHVLQGWWRQYGRPAVLQSDNGLEFAAGDVRELCRQWGVKKRHSRPHKPSTNGSVERANRDVQDSIYKLMIDCPQEKWVDLLDRAVTNHNWMYTRVIKASPWDVFRHTQALLTREDTCPLPTHAVPAVDDWGSESDSSDDEPPHFPHVDTGADSEVDRSFTEERKDKSANDQAAGPGDEERMEEAQCMEDPVMATADGVALTEDSAAPVLLVSSSPNLPIPRVQAEADASAMEAEVPQLSASQHAALPDATGAGGGGNEVHEYNYDYDELEKEGVCFGESLLIPEPGPPSDTTEEVLELKPVSPGCVASMRFMQWVRISADLYKHMRRAYVAGYGDCGIISRYAAYHQHHIQGMNMTDEEIRQDRKSDLDWLSEPANAARYEAQKHKSHILSELRLVTAPLRSWVPPDSLWVYANRHALNIYLCTIQVWHLQADKEKRSSFEFRLITPQHMYYAEEPISADCANTIAIYFHIVSPVKPGDGRQGGQPSRHTGHYEYLVDKAGHSCWRTDDPVVRDILQPALEQAMRVNYLNHYTQTMESQAMAALSRQLPAIAEGDLVMWMIPDYLRDRSDYRRKQDGPVRNMLVRVIQCAPQINPKRKAFDRFRVLSYAGVIKECADHGELRTVGQDLDPELKSRVVTSEMKSAAKLVPLMTAWNFYLDRIRRGRTAAAERAKAAARLRLQQTAAPALQPPVSQQQQPSSGPELMPESVTPDGSVAMDVEAVSGSRVDLLSPMRTRSQRHAAAAIAAGAEVAKCCVCMEDVLPIGAEMRCAGCNQTMHGLGYMCRLDYVPVGGGMFCCSERCALVNGFL